MNLPAPFISTMRNLLNEDFLLFAEALDTEPPVSVRVNDKTNYVPSSNQVPWCRHGYYLNERPLFTADPLFHAGAYYVQEASSMFLWQALEQCVAQDSVVLDLSAAPGGKSTLISQFLNSNGLLVSNEIVRSRAYILAENMIKWGNANCLVSNNSPADFARLPSFFDVIVVDAPCSGEGMFRKDAGAIDEWSESNVLMCAERQRDILASVWDSLKTGGTLIYSTCTYNRFENEDNVNWIAKELGAEVLKIDVGQFPEITISESGYRFLPHKTRGEGFFLSVLRKTADAPELRVKKKRNEKQAVKIEPAILNLRNQLMQPETWEIAIYDNSIVAIPLAHVEKLGLLKNMLKVLHAGIVLAEQKGKDFIPHISLALSKQLNADNVNHVEVDKATAIQYLRRESIVLPECEKAYVLLRYEQVPIGWVKNLGNRSNNLYPTEWRIRMRI